MTVVHGVGVPFLQWVEVVQLQDGSKDYLTLAGSPLEVYMSENTDDEELLL